MHFRFRPRNPITCNTRARYSNIQQQFPAINYFLPEFSEISEIQKKKKKKKSQRVEALLCANEHFFGIACQIVVVH